MRIHILGICGTFMGGLALIAKEAGFEVCGADANVYPPMSTQLAEQGIRLIEGYRGEDLEPPPDCVVVGNAMSRGNPAVEAMLNRNLSYTSGPQWLFEQVLRERWVLAVAGTHGKTTTASMLAWILEDTGLEPGFLIGGVPENFGISARLGHGPFFVVEADEYDTAFFDKRSKFVHYHPRTLVLNNLEFDHADIFDDLAAIQRQFHHLVRIVPGEGLIITHDGDPNLDQVLTMGCWTPRQSFGAESAQADWEARLLSPDGSRFEVSLGGEPQGCVEWELLGSHNVNNALAAIAAARHAGVPASQAVEALGRFQGVKRRLQVRARANGITVYDDFAHHPTEIRMTLAGLRARVGDARVIAVLEPRSNTMRMGVHQASLAASLREADRTVLFQPADLSWDLAGVAGALDGRATVLETIEGVVDHLVADLRQGDHVLIMSNGSFGGLHDKLVTRLNKH